jgi:hypothetical protein
LEYLGGWSFTATTGIFDKYIDKWMQVKMESTGGKREIAKLYLNSLYGKFGSNPVVSSKIPYLNDEGVLSFTISQEQRKNPIYTAMAVFITAYAREHIITNAQQNYDTFAYCDTDSLHLMTPIIPDGIEIHPVNIGAFKHEYSYSRALYMGSKKYFEEEPDGTKHNHIAGVPRDLIENMNIDDVKNGMVIGGKLIPVRVPGGTVLKSTEYTLNF